MKIDGKLVKSIRREAKIRREDLAKMTGVSYSLICKLESGERSVRFNNFVAIAEALDRFVPGAKKKLLNSVDENLRSVVDFLESDLIDREQAYEVLTDYYGHRLPAQHEALRDALSRVPSVRAMSEGVDV